MDVYIGNLPGGATLAELHEFIGDFKLRADFQCCKGQAKEQGHYHFFIARTQTRKEGLEMIAQINGRVFEGVTVVAREYHQRQEAAAWNRPERRINPAASGR
jgi:hypothetical protein